MPTNFAFLRNVPLFADLQEADLEKLCLQVEEMHLGQGELLFTEGSLGQDAYVIKEGKIEIFKTADGKKVQLALRQAGDVIGEMALLQRAPRSASGQALTDCQLVVISQDQLNELLSSSPSASRTMLQTVTGRLRNTELMLRQSEKMAQLGTLVAGIAHELNNPSSAVSRGAKQLSTALADLQQASARLFSSGAAAGRIQDLEASIRAKAAGPVQLGSLARSDLEARLEEWLEMHDLAESWELAPQLANLVSDTAELDAIARETSPEGLLSLLDWMAASYSIYSLLEEVGQGAGRISEIVRALKTYSYLDRAPVEEVDVLEGLENTLVILRHKLKQGVEVIREYSAGIPPIQAYGSELNQVWTNIIDNSIDAMEGQGRLVLRARFLAPWVTVEIEDSGPGIPPEVQSKMFNPFFTTKPLGKGTGLGLNITYNIIRKHGGDIVVDSQPGRTVFTVHLPLTIDQKEAGSAETGAANPEKEGSDPALPQPQTDFKNRVVCQHLDQIQAVKPNSDGCEECRASGDSWVHLRMCMVCGKVGCCDESKNKHASQHFHASQHAIIRSLEPGEDWMWCYLDRVVVAP